MALVGTPSSVCYEVVNLWGDEEDEEDEECAPVKQGRGPMAMSMFLSPVDANLVCSLCGCVFTTPMR